MRKLYDNYKVEVWEAEDDTLEENKEEDEFIFALLETKVMLHAMEFLANKGYIKNSIGEYKNVLKLMWFHLYPRKNNVYGSSGFEHVYLTEKKAKNKLIGLHNWVFFAQEELSGKLNYLGYTRHKELNDASIIYKFLGYKFH